MIVGGIGILGIGVGAVSGLLAMQHRSDVDDACGGSSSSCRSTDPPGVWASQNAFETTGTISTIGWAAGGVALVAGAVLYFTAKSPSGSAMQVAPLVARGGGGVAFGRAW